MPTGRRNCCNQASGGSGSFGAQAQSYAAPEIPIATDGAIYAAEDIVGGQLHVAPGGDFAILNSLTLIDPDLDNAALKLFIFDALPGNYGDQTPFDPSQVDLANLIATIYIPSFNYESLAGIGAAYVPDINQVVPAEFWAYLVTDGSTPDYNAVTLNLKMVFDVYG